MIRPARLAFVAAAALFCAIVSAANALAEKKPPAKPIDLNSATIEQLQQLPGVGLATAKAIVKFREKSGPFRRVEDLLAIRGISKQRLEKIRPYVTIGPPPPAKKSG
jgi:competence ComEA-like helix-hairpin-helix protein